MKPTVGLTELKVEPALPRTAVDAASGALRHEGFALSLEGMESAIAEEARRKSGTDYTAGPTPTNAQS